MLGKGRIVVSIHGTLSQR